MTGSELNVDEFSLVWPLEIRDAYPGDLISDTKSLSAGLSPVKLKVTSLMFTRMYDQKAVMFRLAEETENR